MPAPHAVTPRPSGWWYVATLGIGAVAVVIAVSMLIGGVHSARSRMADATRVDLGTPGAVTFLDPGSFTLYYFGPVQVNDPSEVPGFVQRIAPELRSNRTGVVVEMHPYEGSIGIERDHLGHQEVALGTFHISQPGDYTLDSRALAGVGQYDDQLAVAKSPFGALGQSGIGAGVVVLVGGFLSLLATIGLAMARGRSRRAQLASITAAAYPPNPAGAFPPSPWPAGAGAGSPPGWQGPPPIVPPPPPGYGPADRRQ